MREREREIYREREKGGGGFCAVINFYSHVSTHACMYVVCV